MSTVGTVVRGEIVGLGAEVVGIVKSVFVVGVVFIVFVVFGFRGRGIEGGWCEVLPFFGVVPSPAGIVG